MNEIISNIDNDSSLEEVEDTEMTTRNMLLLGNLKQFFYKIDDTNEHYNLNKMMKIINGESIISLRILDWFVTNYAKQNFVVYELPNGSRFKVHNDYKLKLKSYSKRRFDPFCRWERIRLPFNHLLEIETTIGQLNFFKWSIENKILEYIEDNFDEIEKDMNKRNSIAKHKKSGKGSSNSTESSISSLGSDASDISSVSGSGSGSITTKTRKKREELSVSACKCVKKEFIKVVIKF